MNALVTVTSQNYLAGTKVLLQSFVQNNARFSCDFIVVHNGLAKACQQELTTHFPIKFVEVSTELKIAVERLSEELPQYKNKIHRFWSIEAFNLSAYEKVLFLDSDILIRGSLQPLFEISEGFSACPDRSSNTKEGRDKITFQRASFSESSFERVFNSGVFIINNSFFGTNTFLELVNGIKKESFKSVSTGHTDQFLLNKFFDEKVNWLEAKYNWLLKEAVANDVAQQAVVWHFLRHPKPWIFRPIFNSKIRFKTTSPFLKEWHRTYRTVLMRELKQSFKLKTLRQLILSKVLS